MSKAQDDGSGSQGLGAATVDPSLTTGTPPWDYAYTRAVTDLWQATERVRSSEINAAAQLRWGVFQTPAFIYLGDSRALVLDPDGRVSDGAAGSFRLIGTRPSPRAKPVPRFFVNVRDDTNQVIGLVKKRYRIFQNSEAPVFLDALVDSHDATYETAGSLHGGSQVWWLMKLRQVATVANDERETLDIYLLFTNSHDGSTSMTISALAFRRLSQNTLAWPLPGSQRTKKLRHTDSARRRELDAQLALDLCTDYAATLAQVADKLANASLSDAEFERFVTRLLPTPKPTIKDRRVQNQRGITMAENAKRLITQIYEHNVTQKHLHGTLWGAVQACQFYSDHLSINRNTDDATAAENRFKRLTSGANLGTEACALALQQLAKSRSRSERT